MRKCEFTLSDGFHTCGSYAFNLRHDGIEQGNFCDAHYWQDRAQKAEARPAVPVPQGYVLVPIEPTQEMLEAGVKEQHGPATYKAISHAGCSALEGEQYANYQAMLAASPTPPKEPTT